ARRPEPRQPRRRRLAGRRWRIAPRRRQGRTAMTARDRVREAARSGARLALALSLALRALPAHGEGPSPRSYPRAEAAVKALYDAAKGGKLDDLVAIFGPESRELVDSSDPAAGRRNRQVFVAAMGEGWRLVDRASGGKELVLGNEAWPFPIPL